MKRIRNKLRSAVIAASLSMSACATVEGPANPDDPWEGFNRSMYEFNDAVDRYAFTPVAKGYQYVTPEVVDTGITNFFNNLDDILVFFNNLMQLKFDHALHDSARVVWNSTVGLLGFIDVATEMGLPKHNEDFGQTLGYWGVPSGNYLVLPLIGPSSVRDGVGFAVDVTYLDVVWDDASDRKKYGALALKYIDQRADLLGATNIIQETAPDPYAFIRDAWIQRRQNLVYDGNPPEEFSDDELFEDDLFIDDIQR